MVVLFGVVRMWSLQESETTTRAANATNTSAFDAVQATIGATAQVQSVSPVLFLAAGVATILMMAKIT